MSSKAERKAMNNVRRAMHEAFRREFTLEGFDLAKPSEARKKALDLAAKYPRASHDAICMRHLAAAFQGYAAVHERAEKERARQAVSVAVGAGGAIVPGPVSPAGEGGQES